MVFDIYNLILMVFDTYPSTGLKVILVTAHSTICHVQQPNINCGVFRGGGGALSIYIGGGVPRHIQKGGVLGTGTTQKGGVLGTGTSRKRGVLGTGTIRKRGVLRTGLVKKTILVTDGAQKGFFKLIY